MTKLPAKSAAKLAAKFDQDNHAVNTFRPPVAGFIPLCPCRGALCPVAHASATPLPGPGRAGNRACSELNAPKNRAVRGALRFSFRRALRFALRVEVDRHRQQSAGSGIPMGSRSEIS